jgi:hypothetical protein
MGLRPTNRNMAEGKSTGLITIVDSLVASKKLASHHANTIKGKESGFIFSAANIKLAQFAHLWWHVHMNIAHAVAIVGCLNWMYS